MGFSLGKVFGGVADAIGLNDKAKQFNKNEKDKLAQILASIGQTEQATRLQSAQARQGVLRGLPMVRKTAANARANLGLSQDRTARAVTAREPAALASADQSLFGQGFGASNIVGLTHRGIRGDTQRAWNEIDDLFAQHFGAVDNAETNAVTGIQGQAAGIDSNLASILASLGGAKAGAIGNKQFAPKAGLGELVQLGGQIAALANGIPAGGGAAAGGGNPYAGGQQTGPIF